jgi:2',3'-cyclic-nucleotide 2'-phosphodiesterase (5'-nucleotidase family)
MARITVFHTSDMHNKLNAELALRLHELKSAVPGSIMLDSGDAIWSGNIYWRPDGEPVLDLMNSVPYDALAMGNREFHFMGIGVDSKTSRAGFPILSANIRSTRANRSARITSHIIVESSGVRIAIFGLSVPCVTEQMLVRRVSDYYFIPPIDAAADIVPMLRKDTDIVIALTHIGIKPDRVMAESVPGIDIILGGHTHALAEERVGRTWILHHGFYAHQVGRIDVDFNSGHITGVSNELIPLAKA